MPTRILFYVSITRNKGVRWPCTETVSQIKLSSLKLLSGILWQECKALTSATTCNLLCASWEKYAWLTPLLCVLSSFTQKPIVMLCPVSWHNWASITVILELQVCLSLWWVYIPVNPSWLWRSWDEHVLICLTAVLGRVLIAGSLDHIAGGCGPCSTSEHSRQCRVLLT